MELAFIHGFILAGALILPLGPQNTFVLIQGATHHQYRRSLPVVIVAALSDNMLIVAVVLGASLLLEALPPLKIGLTVLGVVFLAWMAIVSRDARASAIRKREDNWLDAQKACDDDRAVFVTESPCHYGHHGGDWWRSRRLF